MQNFLDINIATLSKYFTVDGTTSRRDFWYFILFNWFASLAASILDIFIPGNPVQNVASVIFFIPTLTAAIRRMHDTDRSGWWLLFPVVNLVFLLSAGRPNRWSGGLNQFKLEE